MTRVMRLGKHLTSGAAPMNERRGRQLLSPMAKSFPLHCDCWWFVHYDTRPPPRLCFALADRGGTFPPPLLLQQLDAVVDVKLDGPPVSLVTHQQGAEFEAALAVRLGGDAQLHEVSLQVSLHCYTLRLRPGTLQHATLP